MTEKDEKVYPLRLVIVVGIAAALGGGLIGYLATSSGGEAPVARPPIGLSPAEPVPVMSWGQTAKASTGNTITPLSFTVGPIDNWPTPPAGYGLSKLEIRFCNAGKGPLVPLRDMTRFFTMYEADRTAVSAEVVWHNSDELASAGPAIVYPGECAKGTIVFTGPTTSAPAFVSFSGVSNFEWKLPGTTSPGVPSPS